MFEKSKLRKKINACKKEIQNLENRRIRSQAALLEAILANKVPDDRDVDYFNNFTNQINEVRDRMKELQDELAKLENK